MSEIFINKARAVAVTGHRAIKNIDREKLKLLFCSLIEKGYNTFLIGMALGFDTLCFETLVEIRKEQDIKLIACIPCEKQDLKFTLSQKKNYENMLSLADEKVYVGKEYTKTCMQKRNEFMVDHSSLLVAYLRRNFGGTFNTVRYAEKKNQIIINI
ncbi:MAG: DUF1273 family protein [Firmicutes bacterium]|nr:DUF1273 family protein [Candidatus Caballimonas caccae]